MPTSRPNRFMLLVYRMPARPTANRVYVWRMLKKLGAVNLQQSVTVFPRSKQVARDLEPLLEKIKDSAGEYHLLPLQQLPGVETDKLIARFIDQTARHYLEIIENCEINFTKEIEFETFRRNFTYEEAEEIRIEYEKIVGWLERVSERDWFGAPNREAALGWLERCRQLLEGFEAQVFRANAAAEDLQSFRPESTTRRSSHRRRAMSLAGPALRVITARPAQAEGLNAPDVPDEDASIAAGGPSAADRRV